MDQNTKKPISELLYRLIALFFVLVAFVLATIATILDLPPANFIKNKMNIRGEDGYVIIWFVFFILAVLFVSIFMRLIKPYADVPKNPYGQLNIKSFFKGDADQDEYKINDKN